MSLATGKQLHDFIWTVLPINDQVIYRVNNLATKENQPEITKGYPIFEWRPGIPITEKYEETQSEEDEISSIHEDEHKDYISKMEIMKKSSKKRNIKIITQHTGRII